MKIRSINFADPDEVHAFYRSSKDAETAENPDRPMWSEKDMVAHITEPDDADESHAFGAFDDDGRLVGGSMLFIPLLDNLTMAYVGVFVSPAEQGKGIGGALAEHILEQVRAAGRTKVLTEASYGFEHRDDHGYRRFAERYGFVLASTEVSRLLDLPIPDKQLQEWIDEAAPHHSAYRIETFVGNVPDELLPSICHVINQLALDAPTGAIDYEAEKSTPEVRRQQTERNKRTGLRRYETVAIDESGEVIAVSVIAVPADGTTMAQQWATIVLREHRGHRLGLALKAHNLRALQRDHPERVSVHTCNEEHNGPMLDINERFGFKPVELLAEFICRLDG